MKTQADDALKNAKVYLADTIGHMAKIVVEKVDGHDDFNPIFREKIYTAFSQLISIRESLS